MKIGLHVLGIGTGARRDVLDAVARTADAEGFSTLWAGEHVVMIDEPASQYPYASDGRIPVPSEADWLDPMIGLSFAAAATSRIRVATGILLLPEHQPVLVAKQAASVDVLSGGRLTLGVGIGWSAEEFEVLGVPFEGRGRRTEEYVQVLRTLWRDEVATFHGEFVSFDSVRVNPRPLRNGWLPVYFGGNSDRALRRAAAHGDGWYGFNVSQEETAECVVRLHRLRREAGRDPGSFEIVVAPAGAGPADRERLADLGVDELVVVDAPPPSAPAAAAWVSGLARTWLT